MSTLTITNLDDDVENALRLRAVERGTSLEAEARRALGESVIVTNGPRTGPTEKPRTGAELLRRIREIVEPVGGIELELPPRKFVSKDRPFG